MTNEEIKPVGGKPKDEGRLIDSDPNKIEDPLARMRLIQAQTARAEAERIRNGKK